MTRQPIIKAKALVERVFKSLGLIFPLLFLHAAANAQIIVSGKTVDSTSNAISGTTVYYTATNGGVILGFARSDKDGNYLLKIKPTAPDSILLHFSCIGYWDKIIKIKTATANIKCTLSRAETKLPDVIVKNKPIQENGDSINYNVSTFTDKTDRSIGDVLKKMPGITVGDDGQIKYQGNAIQKLSVNGLNLMEGRYGVITNNMPAAAVNKVQVIEHDQPIKILDSLVPSNGTSINLKLKKLTTTGNAEIGVGLTPFLRDINLSHMAFLKKFQTINTFASNNVGKDQATLFQNFQPGGFYDNRAENLPQLLSAGGAGPPPLSKTYWLNNNINLFTSNSIWKTSKNWEFKINVGYYNDRQKREGNSVTQILTNNQTITAAEDKHSISNIKEALGNIVVEKNTKKLFFRDNFSINQQTNADSSRIVNDDSVYTQQAYYKKLSLANRLSMIVPVGKQLVTINSQLSYARQPEWLHVQPVPFKSMFNDSAAYNLNQNVFGKAIKLDNYAEITKGIRYFSFSPKIGYSVEHTLLNSGINLQDSLPATNNTNYFANGTNYWRNQFYASLTSRYIKSKRLTLTLTTPVSATDLRLTTPATESNRRLTFLPSLYGEYKITSNFSVSLFGNRDISWPGITNFFRNYILTDYRDIGMSNMPISAEQKSYNYSAGAEYKNTATFLFLNGSISYDHGSSNYIDSAEITPNGATLANTVMLNNKFQSASLSFDASKTIISAKTALKLSGNININKQQGLLDGAITPLTSKLFTLKGYITTILNKYIILEYNSTFNYGKSKAGLLQNNAYMQSVNHLAVSISPIDGHVINVSTDAYSTTGTSNGLSALMNAYYKIKFAKWKTDLYVYCNNIFNTKYYSSFYSSANVIVQSNYLLRQRQAGVSYKFMF